jgi:undecaprenyl-diphosphatase
MKTKTIAAVICLVLFLLLIAAVKTVDVAPIGPEETSIGLSGINGAIHEATGVSKLLYKLTIYLGYLSILAGLCFALLGLIQLIQRKSLLKVDREILVLGCLLVVLALLYVLFEFVVIDFRPVVMPGEAHPEASFPSSHTMLTFVILGSIMMIIGRYVKNRSLRTLIQVICGLLILVMVFGRLLSGVHWFTDILGGVLISGALLFLFAAVLDKVTEKQ